VADITEQAREAAIRGLTRDLEIDRDEAERWCAAWQEFARRNSVARGLYFWDAGRGWIDAQRAMGMVVRNTDPSIVRVVRSSRASAEVIRRVARAS
jgi:hypothetical protein